MFDIFFLVPPTNVHENSLRVQHLSESDINLYQITAQWFGNYLIAKNTNFFLQNMTKGLLC